VDARCAQDEGADCGRRRRVVLTPRRWSQVGGSNSADDGGKRAPAHRSGDRGEHAISVKTIAQGRPDQFGEPVVTCSCALSLSHARLRVHWAPGFPAPSELQRAGFDSKTRAQSAARMRMHVLNRCLTFESEVSPRHCEERSDEAIHFSASGEMDCFASLAMTLRKPPLDSVSYLIVIASPLRSAFAISPTWRPDNSSTAPFWLVSTMARAPPPTARPAPAAP
jgi:hypothetical protein